MRKPTINDVAKHANVSVTTVSLALSGKGRISDVTVQKINQVIDQLGYVRNKNAARLRSGQSAIIGVIVRDIRDAFYASIITGINEVFSKQDYILFLLQSDMTKEGLLKSVNSLIEQDVSGIILGYSGILTYDIKTITDKHKIPLVIVAQSSSLSNISQICSDNRLGAELATEYFIGKGYRQIAYLGGRTNSLTRAERLAGFGHILAKHGLKFRSEWIIPNERPELLDDVSFLLKQHPNVTAFLCHDTSATLSLILSASKFGRTIGKGGLVSYLEPQVEIMSFATQAEIQMAKNLISYIDNKPIEIGRQAAYTLLQKQFTIEQIIISPELVID